MKKGPVFQKCYLILSVCIAATFLFRAPVHSQDKFNLKPGAKGELCFNCHEAFKEKLKEPFVHTPVKGGECTGCHNPHASDHGKLLGSEPTGICLNCHQDIVPVQPVSSHKMVMEGNCVKCHDPHASKNKFNLVKPGNAICAECHQTLIDSVSKLKFKHSPVEKGCAECHTPHASSTSDKLLKTAGSALCTKCHQTSGAAFKSQHMNYPVETAGCNTCHNPHGSNQKGLVYEFAHKPFVSKMCGQCHEGPGSPDPLKLKKDGSELCRSCHSKTLDEIFGKKRIHWPVVDKVGCLNCHNPHASPEKGLMRGPMTGVCGQCHSDTTQKQQKVATKHKPVEEGTCSACHLPHSSDTVLLMNQATVIDVCGTCHEWHKHSTHPIGKEVLDPRNKSLTLDCLSCHRSHGTDYKYMMYDEVVNDLCVRCHKKFKR